VTADDDILVSALSAVFNFFVHSFKKDFNGSSVPVSMSGINGNESSYD
jgi:hypothetical protein